MITMRQLRRVRFVEVSENNVFVRGRRLSPQTFCAAEVAHRYRQSGTGSVLQCTVATTPRSQGTIKTNQTQGEATQHRTEWCAAANAYRCMGCGRSSKNMKMLGTCEGPKWLREDSKHKLGRWSKPHLGAHGMVRRVNRNGEALIWCRKRSGDARQRVGPTLMNRCKPEKMNAKENGKMLKKNDVLTLEEEGVPGKNARGWKIEGLKRVVTRKERKRRREELEVGGFMSRKGLWNIAKKENVGRPRSAAQ